MTPYSLLLDNSLTNFLLRLDEQGEILYMNNLMEGHVDHIQPKNIFDIIKIEADRDKMKKVYSKAVQISPFPTTYLTRLLQKTGAYRWSSWEIYFHDGVYTWLGHQLYDVVSVTSYQYEEVCLKLEKINWIQSHLVRRPLSSIMAIASMIDKDGSDIEELSKMLLSSSKELDDVIRSIVNIASD